MGERTWDCEALESIQGFVTKWRQDAQTLRLCKVDSHAELIEALLEDLDELISEIIQRGSEEAEG